MEEAAERTRGPVWARETSRRRSALSRQVIVDGAIALADAEGLAAVSIRRVAAELGVRAMTLYTHIERKEDLLDLMYDQVGAETCVRGELPRPWREAVLAIARATRRTLLRHPWMVDLAAQRPKVGPNGLRHGEQSMAALAGLDLDTESKWRILTAVDDYVLGHAIREVLDQAAPGRGAMTRQERDQVLQPYLRELVGSGDYPNLAPLLENGAPAAGDNFEQGLAWLLDGVSAALSLP